MALPTQNYSFIDDLLGGIRKQSDDAAAYRAQQDDLRMRLALLREDASPEAYATMKDIYGDRFPQMFEAPHALDYLRGQREGFDREAAQLIPPSPEQIQAGGFALGARVPPPLPPIGPTAQTFMQPRPPMALPAFDQAPEPAVPAEPISPTLQMAAGAVPEPTEQNPLGRLFPGTTAVLKGQDALANRANPTLTAAQQMALDRITGKRNKRDSELLAEAGVPVAGRGYVTKQEQAAAALDQKLNKMSIEDIMALIKVAGAVDKNTGVTGKIVNEQGKLIQGEANAAQKSRNAGLMAGQRASSSGTDRWLEAQKARLASTDKELAQALKLDADLGMPIGRDEKRQKAALAEKIAALRSKKATLDEVINTRFPGE